MTILYNLYQGQVRSSDFCNSPEPLKYVVCKNRTVEYSNIHNKIHIQIKMRRCQEDFVSYVCFDRETILSIMGRREYVLCSLTTFSVKKESLALL